IASFPAVESPTIGSPSLFRPHPTSERDSRKKLSRILTFLVVGSGRRYAIALAQPFGKEDQSADYVYEAGGNPHDQAPYLLVFEGCQSPVGRGGRVNRIPDRRGKSTESPENTGVHSGGEQIQHTGTVTDFTVRIKERPPEKQCRPEEAYVLRGMNPVIVERCLEEAGHVP